MNMHPVMLMMLANQRQRELAHEADRHRLLTSVPGRPARPAGREKPVRYAGSPPVAWRRATPPRRRRPGDDRAGERAAPTGAARFVA
jgi:hypothetical protein